MLHRCLEHFTGFQLKRGFNAKLLACAFSVSLTTPCHLTFPTFFVHTNHLERCTLLTSLCFQFLTSVWRPLTEDLSLFLAPLSGIPYLYLSEKLSFSTFNKKLKTHLFEKHLSLYLQVCSSVYVVQLVCVCVCVCVCDTLFMGMAAGVMYMML